MMLRGGGGGGRLDPSTTPQNEVEREAVRDALRRLREEKKEDKKKDDKDDLGIRARGQKYVSVSPRPARLTVRLPADARLFIDGELCPLTSASRSFNTPALQPGKEYHYNLRMEVTRNGVRRVQSQRVAFSAGRHVTVDFKDSSPVRTAQR
jgi:uncharacterized protein (TIGR03000 family)